MNIDDIKKKIVEQLYPLDIESVTLFGSYAYGIPHKDSDIDLYVVTKDSFIPQTYQEKMAIKLKVAKALTNLQEIIPIDIITHTKKMHEEFRKANSSFSKEILQNGIKIYG